MNRPFAFLGFSYLLGLLVLFFISTDFGIIFSAVLLLLFFIFLKKWKAEFKIAIIGFSLAPLFFLLFNYCFVDIYEKYEDKTLNIKANLGQILSSNDYSLTYEADIFEIDGEKISSFKAKLSSTIPLVYDFGDSLEAVVTFTNNNDDNSVFSLKNSMISDGYSLFGRINRNENYSIYPNNYTDFVYEFRRCIINKANEILSDDIADLMIAMLVGDNSRISDDIYTNFLYAGVNHIIVVSGMHLSLIFLFATMILRKIKLPFLLIYFILIPTIIFYMLVCGMGKSVLRSGIMFIGMLIGKSLGERSDSLNFLGLSVLLICLYNPYSAVDLGFLLSVSATGGIIFLSPKITNKLMSCLSTRFYKIKRFIIETLAVSVSAFLFVLPILLLFNNYINPISIISSFVLTIPSSAFLVLGIALCGLAFVPLLENLCFAISVIVKFFGYFILHFCDMIADVGRKNICLYEENAIIMCIIYLCLIAVLVFYKFGRKTKITAVIIAFCLSIFVYTNIYNENSKFKIVTADFGYGVFVMMMQDGKTSILSSDGYSSYEASTILAEYGVDKIDYLQMDDGSPSYVSRYIQDNYDVKTTSFDNEFEISENIKIKHIIKNKIIVINYKDDIIIIDKIGTGNINMNCNLLIDCTAQSKILSNLTLSAFNPEDEIEHKNPYIIQHQNPITFIIENDKIKVKGLY